VAQGPSVLDRGHAQCKNFDIFISRVLWRFSGGFQPIGLFLQTSVSQGPFVLDRGHSVRILIYSFQLRASYASWGLSGVFLGSFWGLSWVFLGTSIDCKLLWLRDLLSSIKAMNTVRIFDLFQKI
jgi:hypothetical protein